VTLPEASGEAFQRLAGWQRVELKPGEEKLLTIVLDPRILTVFDEQTNALKTASGEYHVRAGASSADTPLSGTFVIR
jgi:beta-glucosidase